MTPQRCLVLCAFSVSLCLCGSFSSPSLRAASPALSSVTPRGAQRGTDAVFTFNGARLADAKEVLFYAPGVTVSKLEVVNANSVKATVKIAPDCKLGEHAVRLRTASGISELTTFWVGALPLLPEKEPNSEIATAQKVPLNVTVTGVVDNEDVDYFAVECKKGQRLSVEIEALRLANTLFDPSIAILDSKRFELASSDDSPLNKQDGLCSVVVPADGTYYVQVRESAYGGNGACGYRLHVGTFPRPLAVVPAGGKAGEEVEVRFLGDPRGEIRQKIKLPNTPGQTIEVFAQDATGISPSGLPFRVSDAGNTVEAEPNDAHDKATRGELPTAFNGVIDKAGDTDWFRFKGKKGQTFDVHCYARRLGSPLDPIMTLSYAGGGAIAINDDSAGPDSYFRVTLPEDREYCLGVTDHLGKGGPTYAYRVELTPVAPSATLSIPKVNIFSQERQTLSVPRGNRMATLIVASRANFGGELTLGAQGLPAGLSLKAENMPANLDAIPVVFEATDKAEVAGKLVPLTATHADPKHPRVASQFAQTVELVTGGPGQSVYWARTVDRAAIAVTDAVPYSIEIVEPKAPLVLGGSMNLKVVARRNKGFTAAITVYPLFNPPGVSSASAVTIPANGTEVLLPMNAAGNAQVRKWKTAVIAVSDAGQGPMWVSSQLATLDVAAPFVTCNMERGAVEQGKNTDLLVKLSHLTPFQGKATLKLFGLPHKVTAPDVEVTKDSKEVLFKISTDKTSPAGTHRSLFVQVTLTQNGEPVVANSGASELRIDVPVVKAAPPPPKPNTPAVKPPTPAAPPKRLTRLEKLRLEQEEREKVAQGKPPEKK